MNQLLIFVLTLLPMSHMAQHAAVLGKWKSVDDVTGKTVAIVEIYEKGGKIYGKIIDIVSSKDKNKTCDKCTGDDKDQPYLGLVVIKGLVKDGNEYNGGHILDPKYGKLYKCYITTEGPDKLKVRGYIGFSLLGRTQYWHRVK